MGEGESWGAGGQGSIISLPGQQWLVEACLRVVMALPSPGMATLENVGLVTHVWESKHILLVSPGTKGQGERITFIEHLLCANHFA